MALLRRDNDEDLNYNMDTECLLNTSSHQDLLESSWKSEPESPPGPIPNVATVPVSFSEILEGDKPACMDRLIMLNEDVEKLFTMPEKFDFVALSSGSELVTSDRSDPNFAAHMEVSPLRASQIIDRSLPDDLESYSGHSMSVFPHQHHPLMPIRTKSSKHLKRDHEHKSKKKKKKKQKIKVAKSFPSRSAILSPTIEEVEKEEDSSMSDSSSQSGDEDELSNEAFDMETEQRLSGTSDQIMDVLSSGDKAQVTDVVSSAKVEIKTKKLDSETNDFRLDLEDDKMKKNLDSPAIILTTPTPNLSSNSITTGNGHLTNGHSFHEEILDSNVPVVSPVDEQGHLGKVWPKLSDQDKVGFYIGDNVSLGSNTATPKNLFYLGERSISRQESNESQFSVASSTSKPPDAVSIYSAQSTATRDSNWTYADEEPLVSPSAAKDSAKNLKNAVDGAQVKFQMGADSYINLHAEEEAESSSDDDDDEDSDEKGDADAEAEPMIESQVSTERGSKSTDGKARKHRRHHHSNEHYNEEDLYMRRHKGSDIHLDQILQRVPTELDEANLLHSADLEEMASHRLENLQGIRRHKINRKKRNAMKSIIHMGKSEKAKKKIYRQQKKFDHTPHEVFVELDELYVTESKEFEWREKARWIKFEEDVEEGAGRWGRPHVASLSFHSLLELRRGLESGTMLLDIEATDFQSIVNHIIDSMIIHDQIKAENKGNVLRTLLLKHKHVRPRDDFIRRNFSYMNLRGLDRYRHQNVKHSLMKSISSSSFRTSASQNSLNRSENNLTPADPTTEMLLDHDNNRIGKLEFVKVDVDNNMASDGVHIGISPQETKKNIQDIMRRIPKGAEATTVLVGCVDYLTQPAVAFVRLAEGVVLDNLTEVPLPVRFIFLLLGPENSGMDYHEVGRSISTLMSNQHFHNVAYKAQSRSELLSAINEFLDESIVLPPGDWDQKTLLPIMDMARKRAKTKRKHKQKKEETQAILAKEKKDKIPSDPLKRTGRIFGGLINDVKRRYPHYLGDIKDGLNLKTLSAIIFIFFACFAPCIAFGGLLSEKTYDYLGVKETMISTSVFGILFALFAGQPLMIIGATGPVLVYEQSLYSFCKSNNIEFLTFRVWIGFWVMLISIVAVAAESSFLVRYISRFTEEVFAILISLIFIFEVIKKIDMTFKEHPLVLDYCAIPNKINNSNSNFSLTFSNVNISSNLNYTFLNNSEHDSMDIGINHVTQYGRPEVLNMPNTALMSTVLTLGTFLLAHFLKIFRNSKFLGRRARRALGDFGIVISIIMMVLLDVFIGDNVYTQKLSVPGTFQPTAPHKRGWFVNPIGTKKEIEVYIIFGSIIPAALIFMLLYLETQITEMILNKKEFKLKKGSGFHLDQILIGVITFLCSLFGLPFMCPATVRTIVHVSALSIMSTHHAPGEKPKLMHVKEQRITGVVMNTMIGISLFWEPVLKAVPMAVLFGVFLYLGISALSGVQMFKRIKLLLIPVKYHPSRGFVRRVKTLKMHLFTIIQVVLLIGLLIIKSTAAALAFPLFVILLVPLRLKVLPKIFTAQELHELDKEEEDSDDEFEDDPDFYQLAHMPV